MINIKEGICYIIGASKDAPVHLGFKPNNNDLVIAADGGYDILQEHNINADILLGDFDSIDGIPTHKNIIKFPVQKDDTDTFIAYTEGMNRGYKNFVIFGGMGGRFDHTIANIQTLTNIAKNGCRGFLIGDGCIVTAIYNSSIIFPEDCSGIAGVFAVDSRAKNVNIEGMKYSAYGIELTPDMPLGVSNEFINKQARVSVEEGTLLLVWYDSTEKFISHIKDFIIA